MDIYQTWRAAWQHTADALQAHNGIVQDLRVAGPASEAELAAVEKRLGLELPDSFRTTLRDFSSAVRFRWRLPELAPVRAPVKRINCGEISWDLAALIAHEGARVGWAEIFEDAPEEAEVWADKLAFQRAGNGDLLAIDLVAPGNPVVYLDHDGESALHGKTLAPSFQEFVTRWSAIGCVGPESWELKPYLGSDGINATGDAALIWADWRDESGHRHA